MLRLHLRVIRQIVKEKKKDKQVIGILLFGSHARGTATTQSDIDIEIIVKKGKYQDITKKIQGVKVDFQIWSIGKLKRRVQRYPYLSYPYIEEKVLYDPLGFAKRIKIKLRKYYRENPEVEKVWKVYMQEYLKSKSKLKISDKEKAKRCKAFYDMLEKKYSQQHKVTREF